MNTKKSSHRLTVNQTKPTNEINMYLQIISRYSLFRGFHQMGIHQSYSFSQTQHKFSKQPLFSFLIITSKTNKNKLFAATIEI